MTDIIEPLTNDERTVLMIAARGESMIPIGRWKAPIESLLKRGFMHAADAFNVYITREGREASEGNEAAADAEVETAFRKVGQFQHQERDGVVAVAPYGASVVNGKLFFKLLDGSTVTCNCIGEPFASKIVEACRGAKSD